MIFNGIDVSHLKGLSPKELEVEMQRIRSFDPYDPDNIPPEIWDRLFAPHPQEPADGR